jgi:hypothetical protein
MPKITLSGPVSLFGVYIQPDTKEIAIDPKEIGWIKAERLKICVNVPCGAVLLVISPISSTSTHKHIGKLVAVFFDSRREVYLDENGEKVDIKSNIVIPTNLFMGDFCLTEAGAENLRKAYPADI